MINWYATEEDRKALLERGNFIHISSNSFSEPYSTAWMSVSDVQCPRCGNRFSQKTEGGCFGGTTYPNQCECGFPWKREDDMIVVSKVGNDET